jgi:hypothetical protein
LLTGSVFDIGKLNALQWEGLGHEPKRQASLSLDPSLSIRLGDYLVKPNDVIWYRRPRPFSHSPSMAEMDQHFAEKEARRFTDCLYAALELLGCRCVNAPSASQTIGRKSTQLLVAQNSGLSVAKTIMGNNPLPIIHELGCAGPRLIYKGFLPHTWENPKTGTVAIARTSEMLMPAKGTEDVLTYAPGIYQTLIEKRYDVRVIVMGERMRAFMIRTGVLDGRIEAAQGKAHTEEITVPLEVQTGIRKFMASAGIIFGCFDFAVDESEQWVFLEVNEAGQFLFLDFMLPKGGIFEDFLAFITGMEKDVFPPLKDFIYDYSPSRIVGSRPKGSRGHLTMEEPWTNNMQM